MFVVSKQSWIMEVVNSLEAGQKFSSFSEFSAFFQEYQKNTRQIFCVSYSKTVESYNKSRRKKISQALQYASIQYACKCGGKERRRGAGVRPVQRQSIYGIYYAL